MKVWEYIKANYDDCHDMSREQIHGMFYANRELPCASEEEVSIAGKRVMDKLCEEVKSDCYKCLDKYLDTEAREKIPYKRREIKGQISLL